MSEHENPSGLFVQIFRDATLFEMGLVAFIVFPAIFSGYRTILEAFFPDQELLQICILIVSYSLFVSLMIYGKIKANQEKVEISRIEVAKEIIQQHLSGKSKPYASYGWLRTHCGKEESEWTDEFLLNLIEIYPSLFCYQPMAPNSKPGLRLLTAPEEIDED